MAKRKKRLIKQLEGLEKQKQEHLNKLKFEKGRLLTTQDYWKKEIENFDEQMIEKIKKLEKITKKKLETGGD